MAIATYNEKGFDPYLNHEDSLLSNRVEPNEAVTDLLGGIETAEITEDQLPNRSIPAKAVQLSIQGWSHNIAFSVTDADTVAWAAGTLSLADGTDFSIAASNTGNMSATTYIYFDFNTSLTALQTATTASDAVGEGKILIAWAKNSTSEAIFQVFGGEGVKVTGADIENNSITSSQIAAGTITATEIAADSITANEIAANTITAAEIAASTITATEMNVSQLSAIAADLGTITAASVTVGTSGYVKQGQTAYDSGTGWWIGDVSGTPKLSIGNSAGQKMTWDGSNLTVTGGVNLGPGTILLAEANTERAQGAVNDDWPTDKYLVKQITVNNGGVFRISFDLKASAANNTVCYAQVYNGTSAVGTERSSQSTSYTTYTEDIAGWSPGDEVRLYIGIDYVAPGAQSTIRNFKIYVHGLNTATVDTD